MIIKEKDAKLVENAELNQMTKKPVTLHVIFLLLVQNVNYSLLETIVKRQERLA